MADTYFPFDAGSGSASTEDKWAQMAALWSPSGVVADSPWVTIPGGRTFTIPDGLSAWVKGFYYRNVVAQDKTASSNGNTSARIDRLVLRLNRTANTITPVIIEGTPSGSPQAPAIDPTDIKICRATLPGFPAAQNYTNIVQEWTAVSSERGRHRWTGSKTLNPGSTTRFDVAATAYSDALATMTPDGVLTFARAGRWSLVWEVGSQSGDAGHSYPYLEWLGGPFGSLGGGPILGDGRSRGGGFAGAGDLTQTVSWSGLVEPEHIKAGNTFRLFTRWLAAGGAATAFYSWVLYADYLGG